jgi:hypothetical protein
VFQFIERDGGSTFAKEFPILNAARSELNGLVPIAATTQKPFKK